MSKPTKKQVLELVKQALKKAQLTYANLIPGSENPQVKETMSQLAGEMVALKAVKEALEGQAVALRCLIS